MNFADESVFAGKRVFLTGHTGFKGSWLVLWLHRLGAEVTGYALEPPTQPNHFTVADVVRCLRQHHLADIRDRTQLQGAMRAADPDLVIHLAAQSVVRKSYEIPAETFDVNVMGSISVLDAVRGLGKPCTVLMVTSDKCYQNVEQVWGYREDDAMGDYSPYGGSKGAAELAIRSYRNAFFPPSRLAKHGVRLASARAGNVIGGGDWTKDALIVDVVLALQRGAPIRLRSPQALRPWQHVLQCLSGYLTIAAKLLGPDAVRYCSGWNIGPLPGNELPVAELVAHFQTFWKSGTVVDASDPRQPPEAGILRLAIDKAIWELGWRPQWSVYTTLEKTADWYRNYFEGTTEMQSVSLQQIQEYESRLCTASSAATAEQL